MTDPHTPSLGSIRLSNLRDLPIATVLLLVAYVALLMVPVVVAYGSLELYLSEFALIGMLPATILVAVHLWRPRSWTFLAAGIAMSVLPVLILLFLNGPGALANPAAGGEFAAVALALLVLLVGLPAGVHGFRTLRRGGELATLTQARQSRMALSALVVSALVLGAALTAGAASIQARSAAERGAAYDFEPSRTITVTTRNFEFHPADIDVPAGEVVEIVVVNEDPIAHTFTYEKDGRLYDHYLQPGTTTRFLVFFEEPTTLALICVPHEPAMSGTIHAT